MAENLKAGDVVYLPSHPDYKMTVDTVDKSTVTVNWFDSSTGDFRSTIVSEGSLVKK